MGRRKIDQIIPDVIENSVNSRHRSMFLIYGLNACDQVVYLHHFLVKYRTAIKCEKPSILWFYKKDMGLQNFRRKKLKQLKKKYAGSNSICNEDLFDHFMVSSNIKFYHCSETEKILGQTFGMLVIQDFEAVTPNVFARIVECVEGRGMVIFLLRNAQTLEDVFSLDMDSHSKFKTEAHNKIHARFNKRFILSLPSCRNCLVLDDSLSLKLLPENTSSRMDLKINLCALEKNYESDVDTSGKQSVKLNKLLLLCCTSDQRTSFLRLSEALANREKLYFMSLTSGRGRGKSALLGLAISFALCSTYTNVYVTSPHLENLQTLFSFVVKGLVALDYNEGEDFKVLYSNTAAIPFITTVKIFRKYPRTVSYHPPTNFLKAGNADLVVIDEAAAIPLPLVKMWINSCSVFMASTINGYEGTGRSLSLKLVNQLRVQSNMEVNKDLQSADEKGHILIELQLNEAVRYANGDGVEEWLNSLLCLESTIDSAFDLGPAPKPEDCELYYVNRNVLFSYNKVAEKFLQQLVSLFVSSHYKNSPNDLLMMADAPAHHIFCLLPPTRKTNSIPSILCAIQVSLEGEISKEASDHGQCNGKRGSGDLIPWIISQQFQDNEFPSLSSARIVRIATHPNYQRMRYGQHALQLLSQFYEKPLEGQRESTPVDSAPLLCHLRDVPHKSLDYLGVSYGLTTDLFKFWKRAGFAPLYIRQTTSELTAEHTCIMIKNLRPSTSPSSWLNDFYCDFTERFSTLLGSSFKGLPCAVARSILHYEHLKQLKKPTSEQLFLSSRSLQRLNAYCLQQVDYHLILDLLPKISNLYFCGCLNELALSSVQESVLLCMGLQNKSVEETATEMSMETNQVMSLFRTTLKRILKKLNAVNRTVSH